MKFEFNWANACGKTMFNILIGLQCERPKLKGQKSTLSFGIYLVIVSLG